MADLTRQIQQLVGRLPAGRSAGMTPGTTLPRPELRRGEAGFLEAVERLLAMRLEQFAGHGAPLEVRVPWLSDTLWFVRDEREADALGCEGIGRGRVWTARELVALMAVMSLPAGAPGTIQSLAIAKCAVDGDIVNVRRR